VAEISELQSRQTQLLIEQHHVKDKSDSLEASLKAEQQESLSLKALLKEREDHIQNLLGELQDMRYALEEDFESKAFAKENVNYENTQRTAP